MYRISHNHPEKPLKLDVKDKKILYLLSEDSRMPISEIAKKIQLSRDTTNYRITRLKKLNIILNFIPEINFEKLGYNIYHVFLLVDETDKEKQTELIKHLNNHKNTIRVLEYSDRWDLEWVLIAKNLEEFDDITTEIAGKFSTILLEKEKLIEISTYNSILFPYEFDLQLKKPEKKESEYKPDKKDFEILKQLAKNCRQSTYELAKTIDLSPDAINLRIKKLYQTNIINKFSILPNLTFLNYSWHTFSLQMKVFDKKNQSKFKTFVKDHLQIIKAVKTLGAWDAQLYIIAGKPQDFHATIKQIKTEFSDVIKSYDAWVGYKESAFNPIPEILII